MEFERSLAVNMSHCFEPIGHIHTPFLDRFAVPRQPGLVKEAWGVIQLKKNSDLRAALDGLENFSHIWLVFVFHEHGSKRWKPTVRPPRLGGKKKMGVLATRSPHRPNPIGLSCVQLEAIDIHAPHGPQLHVTGVDLIEGTPILDIKPYLAYADSFPSAHAGWAESEIPTYSVDFTLEALADLKKLRGEAFIESENLIRSILSLDPRPAFQKNKYPVGHKEFLNKEFAFDVDHIDVRYSLSQEGFTVISCKPFLTKS